VDEALALNPSNAEEYAAQPQVFGRFDWPLAKAAGLIFGMALRPRKSYQHR
jgi:hypothetical protein